MKIMTRVRASLLACVLAVTLAPGVAFGEPSKGSEAGVGIASALCSIVYGPVKIVYAALGTVFGGFAWGLSGGDGQVFTAVITPAVRGDYVVTPGVLRGERSLEFMGRDPAYRSVQHAKVEDHDYSSPDYSAPPPSQDPEYGSGDY